MITSHLPRLSGLEKVRLVNGFQRARLLTGLCIAVFLCGCAAERLSTAAERQEAQSDLGALSFEQCDIDIRPIYMVASSKLNLRVGYYVKKKDPAGMTVALLMTGKGYKVYDQNNDLIANLVEGTPLKLELTWQAVQSSDKVNITGGDAPHNDLASVGSYVAEPDLSPAFQREQEKELIRIWCRFRGRATLLVVKK
jgi:hypothetical protein